jgi:fibronectin-binding autotransporter adhesin
MKLRKPTRSPARRIHRAAMSSTALSALALTVMMSAPAMAQSTFEWNSTTTDFNTAGNWTLLQGAGAPPPGANDTAVFSDDGTSTVTFANATTNINTIEFSNETIANIVTPEQNFTFNVGGAAANTLNIGGLGVTNFNTAGQTFNVGGAHAGIINFLNSANAGDDTITYNVSGGGAAATAGVINFHNTSTAGGTLLIWGPTFNINGGTGSFGGGQVNFLDSSNAGFGEFHVFGGSNTGSGGTLLFANNSSAGNAFAEVFGAQTANAFEGVIAFTDTSSAGSASMTAHGGTGVGFLGGAIVFNGTSTADFATLEAGPGSGGATAGTSAGAVNFGEFATAGTAMVTIDAATVAGNVVGGSSRFFQNSNAGHATFNVNGGQVAGARGGFLSFEDNSNAAQSTINVNNGSLSGLGGFAQFIGSATAASAFIRVFGYSNTPTTADGTLRFGNGAGAATGGNAFIENGGLFNLSGGEQFVPGGTVIVTTGGSLGAADITNAKQLIFLGTGDGGTAAYFGYTGSGATPTFDITGVVNPTTFALPNGSGTVANVVHIGSIGGGGTVALGANNLFVGGNNFNQTFFGTFTGTGDLVKEGTGGWTLDGSNSGTLNLIDIGGGTLMIGDRFNPGAHFSATEWTVDSGATLSGHGTLSGSVVNNGGVVAPGGTVGTMTISGSYTSSEVGTLSIEVNPAQNSLLKVVGVAGTAFLDGTLNFSFDKGNYNAPRLITFLTAVGGTSADDGDGFDTLTTTGLPPGGVKLKVITLGPSGNTLDLVFLPGSALGGTGIPNMATSMLDQSQDISLLIFHHLQDGRDGTSGVASAALMPQLAYAGLSDGGGGGQQLAQGGPFPTSADRLWIRPFGRWGQTDQQGFNQSFTNSGGGVVGGFDHSFGNGLLVGVAGAYSIDDVTSGSTDGSIDSWRVSAYGTWQQGPFAIDAQGGYTHDSVKIDRHLGLAGTAHSNHDGDEGHAAVQGSYKMQLGSAAVIPWVGFSYVHLSEGSFVEGGAAPGFNLQVASHSTDSAQVGGGARVNTTIATSGGWVIVPEARIGVSAEVASTNRAVTASFPGVPLAGTFQLTGVTPDRIAGTAGLGLVAKASPNLDLFIDADGRFSGNQKAGLISGGLRWTFGAPPPPPPPPVAAAPPPPPAPQPPMAAKTFVVYFDFDKSDLTPEARGIIRQAADTYRQTGSATIKIDGYTDLAGTAKYNVGLSKRRADAVRAELVKDGVGANAVAEAWHGKDDPAVPTPDGVREPRNRRVTLALP